MPSNNAPSPSASQPLQEMIAEADTGARSPDGNARYLLWFIALAWALFQLWYASPLPFIFKFGIINDTEARAIHLSFAVFLTFTAYPAFKRSPRHWIPLFDWLLALLATFSACYLFLFYEALANRAGAPILQDLIISGIGMLLLLEATRRALGPPLMIVALVFLLYCFAGPHMPDVIAHKGASFQKAMSHFWLTTEGVFGVALGVSTNFVFLFVLFGALLEKAGAGNYFIRLSFALLGHLRGGPAKAAVVSSGLSGVISGSSIANVVTTGTFTIPLMKRTGFSAQKAGAIEVAASTNGQLTPPIMGAAAFLMVEYIGISYLEVIKAAILPALISYAALFYIVHLEAVKAGMSGMPRARVLRGAEWLLGLCSGLILLGLLTLATYYGIGWIKTLAGDYSALIVAGLLLPSYLALLYLSAKMPALPHDPDIRKAPRIRQTAYSGLYFLLPVVVLIWCLTVERFSPGLSAFWATALLMLIVLTQRPLLAWMRGEWQIATLAQGARELVDGLGSGARNMIGIGVATATAGIVVGAVTLTGVGMVMTEFVELVSAGNVLLMLIFTALISLILGMGLPTTANYIVVSTLMAPVIVTLGAQHGLIVPLIAVHLFVFYFGILADDTPPVGLAAFAAAAIAKGDPIRTGLQGFAYDIRTAILPFMFIFNTELLLIGVEHWYELLLTATAALTAMLVFAAATQGYWIVKSRWYESLGLVLIAFTLFRPGFWWDEIYPAIEHQPAATVFSVAAKAQDEADIRLRIQGENLDGKAINTVIELPLGPSAEPEQRLEYAGLELTLESDQRVVISDVFFDSPAEKAGVDYDWEVIEVQVATERPNKQWMILPALLLLGIIFFRQRRRRPDPIEGAVDVS